MYIFKNAWLSIKRNKGRNLLIGIIILVIASACAVTLAIKNSAKTLINSYQSQYQVEATISVNRSHIMQGIKSGNETSKEDMKDKFSNVSSITEEDVVKYADSEYVSSYYYTNSISMNSGNIEKASSTSNNDKGMGRPDQMNSADFTLTGYSSLDAMTNFIEGTYTITDGNIDTDFTSNSCVINSELATLNDLVVGDTITFEDPNNSEITYDLIITGIFSDNQESSGMNMFSNSANNIITNSVVINNIIKLDSEISKTVNPTFVLTSSNVVDSFTEEVTSKGLSEYLTISTNLDQVNSATQSIFNLSTYATTFLIITLIIGGVILLVINMINIRERKYEIGVLRTIGMKKSLLTSQFIIELLIVSTVFMILGTGIGAAISVPTANKLLQNEINNSTQQTENVNNNFGPGSFNKQDNKMDKINGIVKVEQISSINAIVDIKVVTELILVGIGITLISGASAMISIQNFSPLTILKERS